MQPPKHLPHRNGGNAETIRQGRGGLRAGDFQGIEHAICRSILHTGNVTKIFLKSDCLFY